MAYLDGLYFLTCQHALLLQSELARLYLLCDGRVHLVATKPCFHVSDAQIYAAIKTVFISFFHREKAKTRLAFILFVT